MDSMENDFMNMFEQASREAIRARRRLVRIFIPALVAVALLLLSIGIVIGKYVL